MKVLTIAQLESNLKNEPKNSAGRGESKETLFRKGILANFDSPDFIGCELDAEDLSQETHRDGSPCSVQEVATRYRAIVRKAKLPVIVTPLKVKGTVQLQRKTK
jgi:hypothetical protein